jgi:hypothetical protein
MSDFLSNLAAITLNTGEAIQPRLPSRFESLRQRVGPVDVRLADLEQPQAPPVSSDAGTAMPGVITTPSRGFEASVAQEPPATPEHSARESVRDTEAAASSTRSEPIRPLAAPPPHRVRERQRPTPMTPERLTQVQQDTTPTPDQPGPATVGPRANEVDLSRPPSQARMTRSPIELEQHEQGRDRLYQSRAHTTAEARPFPQGEPSRRPERPGSAIAPGVVQRTSSHQPRLRFAADAGEHQQVNAPDVPTRLLPERGTPRLVADIASSHTVQPLSQSTGIAQATAPHEERLTPVSPLELSPPQRLDARSWTGFLRPPSPPEPMTISGGRDEARPVIRVTIGRVEVKAQVPPPPRPRARTTPRQPSLSLSEYLKQRSEGRR